MGLLLELKQTQSLSPQMIQFMEILQMNTIELFHYIEKAYEENPALELSEHAASPGVEYRHLSFAQDSHSPRKNALSGSDDLFPLSDLVAAPEDNSLYEALQCQIDLEHLSFPLRCAVICVLSNLNTAGYLEESSQALAVQCGQPVSVVTEAEVLVKSLEPAGIGARSLSECLSLQLCRKGITGLAHVIVADYLDDLAQNQYHHIAKCTGSTQTAVRAACDVIRSLNPKPGASFAVSVPSQYVVPDYIVTNNRGNPNVVLCNSYFPSLNVSSYYQQLSQETQDAEVQGYLNEKIRQATWLVKCIEQRNSTLMNCIKAILQRQKDYFLFGPAYLKPMTLEDISAELKVHKSTVSRVIRGKYIQCNYGLVPISYLFSRAASPKNSSTVSSEGLKELIRSIISEEDKQHPLSDQRICDILSQKNIIVSRRLVSKYRDELGIPPTFGRKTY